MSSLRLICPHCGFFRELPPDKVPSGPLRVTCPKCGQRFEYRKPKAAGPAPAEGSVPIVTTPVSGPEGPPSPARLRDIGELFRDSWELYLRRVGVLMGLYLLAILLFLLPIGLFTLVGGLLALAFPGIETPLFLSGTLTGLAVGSIGLFWGLAAMLFAVADPGLDIKGGLQKGWRRIGAFVWVFSLTGFIVTGGFMLFVIPGIIFSVWFFLAQYALVAEDERGMRALLKSKAYLQGRFFEVLLRLLAIWGVSALLGMIPMFGGILSLLFVPFMLIYGWLIYEDLRPAPGRLAFSCTTSEKALWLLLGALGYLIVPLFFLLLALGWMGTALPGFSRPWRGIGNCSILLPFFW